MSNFVKVFKEGQLGKNIGLTTGIDGLDKIINRIQKKTSIGLVAAPKVGKTTLADFCFILSPYLECLKKGTLDDVDWIYNSFEIDRVGKEFKFAAFFMAYDYKIYNFKYKGKIYDMSQDYLMGKLLHQNEDGEFEIIKITEEHSLLLRNVYRERIVPLFGEYDEMGNKIRSGKIDFIEDPDNPTGMNKYLFHYAEKNGTFIKHKYETKNDKGEKITKERISGYKPKNPDKFTIIITDHVRKMRRERGFTMKENIDKWLEYTTFLRNICGFTFINICHSNRQLSNVDRLKFAGEWIFPTADDVKDTGNIAEESTILLTMFNPNDEKYNISKHFGIELKNFPNYRSIHLTESRYTKCPRHVLTNMFGGINMFEPLSSAYSSS